MKCNYPMCNNLGECTDDMVRVNGKWYCKKCNNEREAKVAIKDKIQSILKFETPKAINAVIKDLVHTRGISTDYILFTLDIIQREKLKLNYARGIIYYLNDDKFKKAYEEIEVSKKYKEIVKKVTDDEPFEIPMFNKYKKENESVTDLL